MASSRSSFDRNSYRREREEYLRNEKTISELAGSDTAYANASQRANTQASIFQNATDELLHARGDANRTAKRLQRERSKKLSRKLFPKGTRDKVAKCEEEHLAAKAHASRVEVFITEAKTSLKKLERERADLMSKAAKLATAQHRKRDILEYVFSEAQDVEEENAILKDRDRLLKSLKHASQVLKTHLSTLQYLQSGKTDLQYASNLLRNLQYSNTEEGLFEDGIEFISGANAQMNVKNARKLAQSAQKKVVRACQLNPKLPVAENAKISGGSVDVFGDIGFDDIFGNTYVRLNIDKAAASTRRAIHIVNQSIQVQKSVAQRWQEEVARFEAELDKTVRNLADVRARILKEGQ